MLTFLGRFEKPENPKQPEKLEKPVTTMGIITSNAKD